MQSKISNNLFYTCSLIEYIGRETKNKRCDIVNALGKDIIEHIFNYADVFHCEPIAAVADRFIDEFNIINGEFDNIKECKYQIPSYWDIGAVYQRLIEGLESENIIDKLIEVYNSWIAEYIDNYNIAVYYMTPQYLKLSYEEGELIE